MFRGTLLLLVFVTLACAQSRPLLKIGASMAHCGGTTDPPISVNLEQALFWFVNYTNAHGGVTINGTVHDIKLITYNDANDLELVDIIYERLVTVDQVDLLVGPFGTGSPAFLIAQKYGIPIMNVGDFGYFSQLGAPNGTFGGWLFSSIPNLLSIASSCYTLLRQQGAVTMSSGWTESVGGAGLDRISAGTAQAVGLELQEPVVSLKTDLSNMKEGAKIFAEQNADIFSGGMYNDDENLALITEMIDLKFYPKATVLWVGPAFGSFRHAAGWKAGNALYPGVWSPSLNYTDALFGDSAGFDAAFREGLGRDADSTDLFGMLGLTAFKLAVERADSKDPDLVRQALLTLNDETWYGIVNFTQAPFQQTNAGYYCFQLSLDGIDVFPVSPNARSYRPIVYPAVLNIPPDYYPTKSYRNLRLGLGIGIGVGVPVMAGLLVGLYFLYQRYQVVFIPKQEGVEGEW